MVFIAGPDPDLNPQYPAAASIQSSSKNRTSKFSSFNADIMLSKFRALYILNFNLLLLTDVTHRPEGLDAEQARFTGTFGTFCVR
jgi:hypothetical protein